MIIPLFRWINWRTHWPCGPAAEPQQILSTLLCAGRGQVSGLVPFFQVIIKITLCLSIAPSMWVYPSTLKAFINVTTWLLAGGQESFTQEVIGLVFKMWDWMMDWLCVCVRTCNWLCPWDKSDVFSCRYHHSIPQAQLPLERAEDSTKATKDLVSSIRFSWELSRYPGNGQQYRILKKID